MAPSTTSPDTVQSVANDWEAFNRERTQDGNDTLYTTNTEDILDFANWAQGPTWREAVDHHGTCDGSEDSLEYRRERREEALGWLAACNEWLRSQHLAALSIKEYTQRMEM